MSAPVVNPEVPAPQQEDRDDDNSDGHDPELPSDNQGYVDLGALYGEITGFNISSKPKHGQDTAAAPYQHYKDKSGREAFITFDQEPKSIEEALARDDADGWWEAIMSEYQSWKDLNVFEE
eukprot:71995-Rhodomonas_salina.1